MKPLRTFFFLAFLLVLALALPACSKKKEQAASPASEQAQQMSQPASPSQADLTAGEKTYNKICAGCHAAGIAGAPKIGDQKAWKDRIAKGMDTLYHNAIKGFQGSSGVMPPKGGDMSLSDQQVKDAVAYMVQQSK
jgi:cytochrome c5